MTKEEFIEKLQNAASSFVEKMQEEDGAWSIKGFIDTHRDVYPISTDTKVISKIVELHLLPLLVGFAHENGLELQLPKEQNFYPDLTFIDASGNRFAVDIKSSYRKTTSTINGMTLGSFTGYFRDVGSNKNVVYPYGSYIAHVVLGIIYSYSDLTLEEASGIRHLSELDDIKSVVHNLEFFVQEKWRIAVDRPGSGNTKNIGSVREINKLINGSGPFAALGEDVFNDYWRHYLTREMARSVELERPYYTCLAEYKRFKGI